MLSVDTHDDAATDALSDASADALADSRAIRLAMRSPTGKPMRLPTGPQRARSRNLATCDKINRQAYNEQPLK